MNYESCLQFFVALYLAGGRVESGESEERKRQKQARGSRLE